MKKWFSFLYLPAVFVAIALTSLINQLVNSSNVWYINLPLVLIMLCFVAFAMYMFSKETENVKKQNIIIIILFLAISALPLYFISKDAALLAHNRVLLSNYLLGAGSIFAMGAFSLHIKRFLGGLSVFYKFVGAISCAIFPFAAIYLCFQPIAFASV